MPNNDGLKEETAPQIDGALVLMMEQVLVVAERMVMAFEQLHARFPSDDLRAGLLTAREWRDDAQSWLKKHGQCAVDSPTIDLGISLHEE